MKTRHFLLILALCALPGTALATTTGVNTIQQAFMSGATGWYTHIKVIAEEIFAVLFGVDIVWMVTQWLIGGKDVHEIFTSFVKKLLSIGFFFTILLNGHALAWDLITGFKSAGVTAAGAPQTGLGWILDTGAKIFNACLKGPTGSNGSSVFGFLDFAKAAVTSITGALTGIVVGLVAIVSLIYMALEYISVQLEAILVTSLGVILLGFGGSKFTSSYVEGYIKYALSVGIRFFVLVVWVSFVENQAPSIITNLLNGITKDGTSNIGTVIYAYGDVLIFVLLIAWLTKKLPALASSILTGSSTMSGGELVSGAVKGAALAAAAVATGGAAAAAGGAMLASTSSGAMAAGTGAAGSAGAGAMSAGTGASAGGVAATVPAPAASLAGAPSGGGAMAPSAGGPSASAVKAPSVAPAPQKAATPQSQPSAAPESPPASADTPPASTEASAPSDTAATDTVDHRSAAPNEAPQSSPSGGSTVPAPDPAMQNLQSQMSEMLARTAPKPQSFSEKVASNEKAINQKLETVTHGESAKANVSAPSLNVKHLSD